MGATNVPWEIDQAMRRRFEKRIYIALPESSARAHMFKVHLGNTDNNLTPEEFLDLGDKAGGYSGSDISVVVREALMEPLRYVKQRNNSMKMIQLVCLALSRLPGMP